MSDFLSRKDCLLCNGTGKQLDRKALAAAVNSLDIPSEKIQEALGITKSHLSYVRSGRRGMGPDKIRKLQKLLKTQPPKR